MSDSSSTHHKAVADFDPSEHLSDICNKTKVTIAHAHKIDYPKGWKTILEELIDEIMDGPVSLILIDSSYKQLSINFTARTQSHELKTWRAIHTAIEKSRNTCSECGARIDAVTPADRSLCWYCHKSANTTGKTGTWLDRHIKDSGAKSG